MPADEPRADLFRPAAVAAHRGAHTGPTTLPTSRRLTSAAFWGITAAVALVGVSAFRVHVDETSAGVWQAGTADGVATVAVPIGALGRIRVGQAVRLRAPGEPVVTATVTAVLDPLPVTAARAQFGDNLPATLRTATAVGVVQVEAATRLATMGGRATVHLGRHSLIAELIPALRHEQPGG